MSAGCSISTCHLIFNMPQILKHCNLVLSLYQGTDVEMVDAPAKDFSSQKKAVSEYFLSNLYFTLEVIWYCFG